MERSSQGLRVPVSSSQQVQLLSSIETARRLISTAGAVPSMSKIRSASFGDTGARLNLRASWPKLALPGRYSMGKRAIDRKLSAIVHQPTLAADWDSPSSS